MCEPCDFCPLPPKVAGDCGVRRRFVYRYKDERYYSGVSPQQARDVSEWLMNEWTSGSEEYKASDPVNVVALYRPGSPAYVTLVERSIAHRPVRAQSNHDLDVCARLACMWISDDEDYRHTDPARTLAIYAPGTDAYDALVRCADIGKGKRLSAFACTFPE
jgi:hypothetical protein